MTRPSTNIVLSRFMALGGLASASSLVCALVRSKVLALQVGPEGLGVLAHATQLSAFATMAASLTNGPAYISQLVGARNGDQPELVRKTLWMSLVVAFITSLVGFLLIISLAPRLFGGSRWPISLTSAVAMASAGALLGVVANLFVSALAAMGKDGANTLHSIVVALLGVASITVLTLLYGLNGAFVSLVVSGMLSAVVGYVLLRRSIGRSARPLVGWDSNYLRQMIIIGGVSLIASYFQQGHYATIRIALERAGGARLGAFYNGQFQAALGLDQQTFAMLMGGLMTFHWPRFGSCRGAECDALVAETVRFLLRVFPPLIFLGIVCRSQLFTLLFSTRFSLASDYFAFFLAAAIPKALMYTYGAVYLFQGQGLAFLLLSLIGWGMSTVTGVLAVHWGGASQLGLGLLVGTVFHMCCTAATTHFKYRVRIEALPIVKGLAWSGSALVLSEFCRRVPQAIWVFIPVAGFWVWRIGRHQLSKMASQFRSTMRSLVGPLGAAPAAGTLEDNAHIGGAHSSGSHSSTGAR